MQERQRPQKGFKDYYPLIVVILIVFIGSLALQMRMIHTSLRCFTTTFMGLFFLVLSMFKLLDMKGFINCFRLYDLAANHFKSYGYVYPFIEIILGVGYLTYYLPFLTNLVTVIVMGYSAYGVIKSVIQGFDIVTTCKSSVLKVPFSAVSIVESTLMGVLALMFLVFRVNNVF